MQRGYTGASLAAIARAAGVSLATVKLVAGTKGQLLVAVLQALMRRGEPGVPLADQSWWRELLANHDPEALLRGFAAVARSALEQQADLFEVVWQAAPSEPELAELERRASLGRWEDVRQVADALAHLGALRSDLTVDTAADIIWALGTPQVFRLLLTRRGWTAGQWEAWLFEALRLQLLAGHEPG